MNKNEESADAAEVESLTTIGSVGIRPTRQGNTIIGQFPQIRQSADLVTPVLDMNPTIIPLAKLLEVLIETGDRGGSTELRGHVLVTPPNPNERIVLTDAGKVVVEEA